MFFFLLFGDTTRVVWLARKIETGERKPNKGSRGLDIWEIWEHSQGTEEVSLEKGVEVFGGSFSGMNPIHYHLYLVSGYYEIT